MVALYDTFKGGLLYSRKESAYLLSISLRELDYLIEDGRLKACYISNRILIPAEELIRLSAKDRPYTIRTL